MLESSWIIYTTLGLSVGFLSGLFGIGGGMIMVPILSVIFRHLHFPEAEIHAFAAGTAIFVVLITGCSSAWAWRNYPNFNLTFIRQVILWSCLGTVIGVKLSHVIPGFYIQLYFTLFILWVALRNYQRTRHKSLQTQHSEPLGLSSVPNSHLIAIAVLVGVQSGFLGLAGGVLFTALLLRYSVSITEIIPNVICCWLPIALVATIGYVVLGLHLTSWPHARSWGYVYWPAALSLLPGSMLTTHLGAWTAKKISNDHLEWGFVWFLGALSLVSLRNTLYYQGF